MLNLGSIGHSFGVPLIDQSLDIFTRENFLLVNKRKIEYQNLAFNTK